MFDPETYNPFERYEPRREAHQRINQINSQVGWPAVLDWAEHDKNVEAMANAALVRLSELDSDPDAHGLALKLVYAHRDHAFITEPGLCAILAFDPTLAIPLAKLSEWQSVATKYVPKRYTTCDVQITHCCDENQAEGWLAIKTGEFVCVFKCCNGCREHFDMSPDERERFEKNGFSDEFDRR
ncbi:hypothetical protein ACP6C7_29120 [Mycolicibacterium septicum]|uniref:Uncharacterized protein n=1 Tax=Mycolicibacterium septicum TaxID=98668 RepID=A0ABW9M0E2_9MYCO